MESDAHREQMVLLIQLLREHWSSRRDYYVSGNMFVYYDSRDPRKSCGPDFFLVRGVEPRLRKSWVVWAEGGRYPEVIVELLSESTRGVDLSRKKALYGETFGTPEYYLYDPRSQEFIAWHWREGAYREAERNAAGQAYSPVMDLYLGVHGDWLRFFTREGDLVVLRQERTEQAEQRAEQAEQRAEQAEQRAEQAEQQTEQEKQRAEQERQRAEQAERLLAAYQQRLGPERQC